MKISKGTALFVALFTAVVGSGQGELQCKAYPVQPVVLTNGPGHFRVENSGILRYTTEEFLSSPDRIEDIIHLTYADESPSWFYHAPVRRWSSSVGIANHVPGWLTIEELEPVIGPIDTPWILYYGPNYLWFKTEGSVQTSRGTAAFSLVFSLSSEESATSESYLDVFIWPQWLDIAIGEVSILTDFWRLSVEERPRGVLHLDFSSPDRASASFFGSHGIFAPQTDQTMTELRTYHSFQDMLSESFAWLAQKHAEEGWRTNYDFGIPNGRDPMKSWGRSPYNELTSDLLVTKAAWRGRDDPEGLEAALAEIEAEYNLTPGELPPTTMRLISGEIPYFMQPPTR